MSNSRNRTNRGPSDPIAWAIERLFGGNSTGSRQMAGRNGRGRQSGKKQGYKNAPAGGWKNYDENGIVGRTRHQFTDVYRTYCGKGYFKFRFVPCGSYYEIDIISTPNYGGRDTGSVATHRLTSLRGGYRICLADSLSANTPSSARRWAKTWAEGTMSYIKSGKRF